MKKTLAVMAALLFSIPCIIEAKEAHLVVFGSGAAKDSDRAAAIAQAADVAKTRLNKDCSGTVSAVEETGIQCYGGVHDEPFTCIVTTRGACSIDLHKAHLRN